MDGNQFTALTMQALKKYIDIRKIQHHFKKVQPKLTHFQDIRLNPSSNSKVIQSTFKQSIGFELQQMFNAITNYTQDKPALRLLTVQKSLIFIPAFYENLMHYTFYPYDERLFPFSFDGQELLAVSIQAVWIAKMWQYGIAELDTLSIAKIKNSLKTLQEIENSLTEIRLNVLLNYVEYDAQMLLLTLLCSYCCTPLRSAIDIFFILLSHVGNQRILSIREKYLPILSFVAVENLDEYRMFVLVKKFGVQFHLRQLQDVATRMLQYDKAHYENLVVLKRNGVEFTHKQLDDLAIKALDQHDLSRVDRYALRELGVKI